MSYCLESLLLFRTVLQIVEVTLFLTSLGLNFEMSGKNSAPSVDLIRNLHILGLIGSRFISRNKSRALGGLILCLSFPV